MRHLHVLALGCMILLVSAATAPAGRPTEKREIANYVVAGKVQAVYSTGTKDSKSYIVEIKVEEVTKGERVKKGDTFRAFCFQNKAPQGFEVAGHTRVPNVGERVRVFTIEGRGRFEGVYPDWFDVLPKADK